MSVSIATKGIICQSQQLLISNIIISELSSECVVSTSPCLCPISYKKGNPIDLQFSVQQNGVKISSFDLQNSDEITFVLKKSKYVPNTEATLVKLKSLAQIDILPEDSDLSVPNVLIPLSSSDMDIDSGSYYIALAIEFSVDNDVETSLVSNSCVFNSISIIQDISYAV